jgi:hypothetical protein
MFAFASRSAFGPARPVSRPTVSGMHFIADTAQGVQLTIRFHLAPRLKIHAVMLELPHMPSCPGA